MALLTQTDARRWFRLPKLAGAAGMLNVVLVLWVAWLLARATWLAVPAPELPAIGAEAARPGPGLAREKGPGYGAIANWHLFGQAKPEQKVPDRPIEAPETRLNVRLMGVLSSSEPENARAIIADARGEQKSYKIGAQLPGNAELKEIYPDRVILLRNQRHETLRLERLTGAGAGPAARSPAPVPKVRPKVPVRKATPEILDLRTRIGSDPTSVMRDVRPVPAQRNGQFIGYRLAGKEGNRLLSSVGLRSGDIITEVNGIKLDGTAKGLEAVQELKGTKQVNLTVLRSGREIPIAFTLP